MKPVMEQTDNTQTKPVTAKPRVLFFFYIFIALPLLFAIFVLGGSLFIEGLTAPGGSLFDLQARLFLFWIVAGAGLFAVIVTGFLGTKWIKGVIRPITELANEAELISKVNPNYRIDTSKVGAAKQIALAINTISDRLIDTNDALVDSEQKYKSFYDNAVEGIFQAAPDGRFVSANPALAELMGYDSPGELLSSYIHENVPFFAKPHQREVFERALRENGTVTSFETRIFKKDKSEIWVRISATAVADSDGEQIYHNGSMIDVTERINKEQAEKERDAAEAASRAKSEFLAVMSHEIRTPMNSILGMADLLSETQLTKEQEKYVDIFKGSGEALLGLINDILDFSKVEAGHLHLENLPFSLLSVVERTCDILAIRAHEKNLEFGVWIDPDTPLSLLGDRLRLRQVLVNLIGNAIKFTHSGEILLEVSSVPIDDGNDTVEIEFSVTDTGIGVSDNQRDAIFETFTQGDSSVSRNHGGTGLGLAICKKIVELMNGEISVVNTETRGSRFFFTAQFKHGPDIPIFAGEKKPDFHGRRILVGEDHDFTRRNLISTLLSWDAEVDYAETWDEVKEKDYKYAEKGKPFDMILVDTTLPDMDLIDDVSSLIEGRPALKDSLVLMFNTDTAGHGMEMLDRHFGIPFDAQHIVKPVKIKELKDICEYVIFGLLPLGSSGKKTTGMALPSAKLLLVDDSEYNRIVVVEFLKNTPLIIEIATNGQEAVDAFANKSFDIVLMDVQMPVMDGHTAIGLMREHEQKKGLPHTPIIATTAHVMQKEMEECLSSGFDAHLPKPLKKRKLLSVIAGFIDIRLSDRNRAFEPEESPMTKFSEMEKPDKIEVDPALKQFVPEYINETRQQAYYIQKLIKSGRFDEVSTIGHSMKGEGDAFGFTRISKCGTQIYNAARQKSSEDTLKAVKTLVDYLNNVKCD